MRFRNKVVLITGAGQNTGVGIAKLFIEEGAHVCINDISKEQIESGARRLRELGYDNFLALDADISKPEQVGAMFDVLSNHWRRIDILVNNACDQGLDDVFENLTYSDFRRVIDTNLMGTFYVSQYVARMMLRDKIGGVIVNLGSNVSTRSIHNRTAYVSSKGGVDALTRSMAIDLAPKGIRVNMVAPGYINTNRWDELDEGVKERRCRNIPLGQEACIEDIAQAVAFLASDAARNICGERLVVDGGCSAQHLPEDVDF